MKSMRFFKLRHWHNYRHDPHGAQTDGKRGFRTLGHRDRVRSRAVHGDSDAGRVAAGNKNDLSFSIGVLWRLFKLLGLG